MKDSEHVWFVVLFVRIKERGWEVKRRKEHVERETIIFISKCTGHTWKGLCTDRYNFHFCLFLYIKRRELSSFDKRDKNWKIAIFHSCYCLVQLLDSMGNCIGKKSSFRHHRRVPSTSTDHSQKNGRSSTKLISTFVFPVPSACDQLISLSKEGNIFLSSLSNTKETGFVLSHVNNCENERKIIQSSSSTTNDQLTLVSSQSSAEYKKCKSNDATPTSLSENHIKQSFTLIINDEDRKTMGHLFNKEKDINKDNIRRNNVENLNTDIKVHENEREKRKHDDQYFTIITEQEMSNIDTMVNVHEIVQGKCEIDIEIKTYWW